MRILLLAWLALLTACATGPEPVSPDSPSATTGSSTAPTPAVTKPVLPKPSVPDSGASAVDSLLAEASALRRSGDIPGSFARLERALRIAPQRAEVYLELARSHAAAGNDSRAAATAERGLLYCEGWTCDALEKLIN